ncbi:hypothetical protein QEG98_34355 [Myxococcus sp. MxC21-1]|uniref:hypothetical protein n=1 Tax=Myxococcus sp. MxC21-1 TaxID=3041439 RepID=UPI00292DA325|nr:hypothetical protein [Myxococcus sp. MxC21-1]WNZ60956.1 hypothetical protein QEG98_34355 [Myxococcus sp. MxC21-1]
MTFASRTMLAVIVGIAIGVVVRPGGFTFAYLHPRAEAPCLETLVKLDARRAGADEQLQLRVAARPRLWDFTPTSSAS